HRGRRCHQLHLPPADHRPPVPVRLSARADRPRAAHAQAVGGAPRAGRRPHPQGAGLVPLLRGNLHAHTTFSDGGPPPAALVEEYETRGYDFLAITDHEDHDNWVEPGYQRALERLRPTLLLFRGIELNFDGFAQHVGKVEGDRETLWILNHPARYK